VQYLTGRSFQNLTDQLFSRLLIESPVFCEAFSALKAEAKLPSLGPAGLLRGFLEPLPIGTRVTAEPKRGFFALPKCEFDSRRG
jgi:hypothetical protein